MDGAFTDYSRESERADVIDSCYVTDDFWGSVFNYSEHSDLWYSGTWPILQII